MARRYVFVKRLSRIAALVAAAFTLPANAFACDTPAYPSTALMGATHYFRVDTGCSFDVRRATPAFMFVARHLMAGEPKTCVNTIDELNPVSGKDEIYRFIGSRTWEQFESYLGVDANGDFWVRDQGSVVRITGDYAQPSPPDAQKHLLEIPAMADGSRWIPITKGIAHVTRAGTVLARIYAAEPCLTTITMIRNEGADTTLFPDTYGDVWFTFKGVNRLWFYQRSGRLYFLDVPSGATLVAVTNLGALLALPTKTGALFLFHERPQD